MGPKGEDIVQGARNADSPLCLLLICGVLFGLAGCSSAPDVLVGEYALRENGPAEVKVSKEGGRYLLSLRDGRSWSTPGEMIPCEDKDYMALFGSDWKMIEPVGCGRKMARSEYLS